MIVDSLEPPWVIQAFPEAKVQRLEIGDIASDDMNTIIERKEINDLASSIKDGRYKSQVATLINLPSFFIIVGETSDLSHYNKPMTKAVCSAIKHIPIKYRIPLIHVKNNKEFIETVKFIMDKRSDMEKELINVHKIKADPELQVLCSLPNISIKRAKIIRSEYNSVIEAIMDVREWNRFSGIGNGIVQKCIEVLE